MLETCYCGRTGELEDRNLVSDDDGREALECPGAGTWTISPGSRTRRAVFEEAKRRAGEHQASAA